MKAVIPENLVTMYDLTVPYALDVRKLRRQLDAELEKLHPCFPSQCAVDYQLRLRLYGQNTSGLHVRAVVMDRLALAAIRKKNAGCFLYTAGSHPCRVFSRDLLKKRMCLAAAVLCAAAVVLCTVFLARQVVAAESDDAVTASPYSETGGLPASESLSAEPVTPPDYTPFFTGMYKQGASISSFLWDAYTGVSSFTATGLYPEQFEAAECGEVCFGPVSYNDEIPVLEVTLAAVPEGQNPLLTDRASDRQTASLAESAGQKLPAIRRLFSEGGGSLLSETVTPPSITGSVPETAWASFAAGLQAETSGNISRLSLSRTGGSISVYLELGGAAVVLPFSSLACVFADAPGLPFAPVSDEWVAAVSESRDIGRIEKEDGSSVVFFHNSEGKIERRVYEN